jgi:hypothetical protein
MYALPVTLLSSPPPRRRVTLGINAPAGVFFALAGQDAILYCKIPKFGAFFTLKSHSHKNFFEIA